MFWSKNQRVGKLSIRSIAKQALAIGIASFAGYTTSQASTYDLSQDFSTTNNPNGSWVYGWSGSLGGQFTPLTIQHISTVDGGETIPSWQLTSGQAPVVYKNVSSNTLSAGNGLVSFAPGEIWFNPGENGRPESFGVIRFTAPSNALYQIGTGVRPVYAGSPQGDTDFHVLKNGVELFGLFLSPTNSAEYSNTVALVANDTVDFVIGRGADGNSYGSGLKIQATITPIEPTVPPSVVDISILNHSFESPVLSDGQYVLNGIPGWVGVGANDFLVANPADNWFTGTSQNNSGPNPIDGFNSAGINNSTRLYQDLSAAWLPNHKYTLTLLMGTRKGVPFGIPKIRLIASGVTVAETLPGAPVQGTFNEFSLNYVSPATSSANGTPIRIEIQGLGGDAQCWVDNVRLSAESLGNVTNTPPPLPPTYSDYSLGRDFSATNNPNGQWAYGWEESLGGAFSVLTVQHLSTTGNGVVTPSWQLTSFQTPAVYYNPTTNTAVFGSNLGTLAPQGVLFYPGENGRPENFGVIRFTAPSNGLYQVETGVSPGFDGPPQGDTDFHVLKNSTELFSQFLATTGTASYSNTLALAAGDTVDFAVGRGSDGSSYGSGLKIHTTITPVGDFASASDLVANGSFEIGVNPGVSSGVLSPDSSTITGWTVETANLDYIGSRWTAGDGFRCLDLSGTDAGTISQIISGLTPGHDYRLSFLMAANPEVGVFTARLRASISEASQEYSFLQSGFSTENLGWTEKTLDFTATGSSHKLAFVSLNPGWAGAALDKISILALTNNVVITNPPPPSAIVFDLWEGVSTNGNPNGAWGYGWSSTLGGAFTPLTGPYYGSFDGGAKGAYWSVSSSKYPAVYKNPNPTPISAGGASYPAGSVWMIPGAEGTVENFGVIRFTVPAGALGNFTLGVEVAPAYNGGPQGDTDFHVLKNGVELFGQNLSPSDRASYTNDLALVAGDIIEFVIGRGADGRLYGSILRIGASLRSVGGETSPLIVVQPKSRVVIRGDDATLAVVATGSPTLHYQWRKGEVDLLDATNSSLTIAAVTLSNAGPYSVLVSNDFGSITSQVANVVVNLGPAILRLASVAASAEGVVELPVELVANGNENAIGFSLNFNPSLLSFAGATLSEGAAEASLIVNTNALANGRVGIALALPSDEVFAEGAQPLLVVSFETVSAVQSVVTPVAFGDQPVLRQVSDTQATALTANYVNGSVSIAVDGLEGDVAPRPGGNGSATIIDWVQVGRFVAALDGITNTLEFQKADSAPRATRGNGVISVSDWVQAGRYAAGLDPIRPAGGPIEPSIPLAAAGGGIQAASGRVLMIPETNALPGTTLVLSVWLESTGNENALAFTLSFDPASLQFIGASKLGKMSAATLNVNANLSAAGKIGIAMALPTGTAMSAGLDSILLLNFAVAPSATGSGSLSFGDSPVFREVADVAANSLSATFTSASVTFGPPRVVGPPLTAARSGNSILLFWPSSAQGFEVYSAASVNAANWVKVPGSPFDIGGRWLMTAPVTGSNQFFRLEKR